MSQQTNAANSNSTTSTDTTEGAATAIEPSTIVKQSSSLFGSLKKQKKKDEAAEEQLSLNDKQNVIKRQHRDPISLYEDKINLNCLLLGDTSMDCAPVHVVNLLQHFVNVVHLTSGELAFLLVYIVTLESGFVSQIDYEKEKLYLENLPATSSFHSKNVFHLSHLKPRYTCSEDGRCFTLKLCSLVAVENDCLDYVYSLLVGFVMGDLLIVSLSPANSTEGKSFSTALSIGRYVLSVQAKYKPLYQRFRKLQELTNISREHLFVPMRCQHLYWLNCSVYPSLNGLPTELYGQIFKNLKKKQLKVLANVNKSLYEVIKHSKFKFR